MVFLTAFLDVLIYSDRYDFHYHVLEIMAFDMDSFGVPEGMGVK